MNEDDLRDLTARCVWCDGFAYSMSGALRSCERSLAKVCKPGGPDHRADEVPDEMETI